MLANYADLLGTGPQSLENDLLRPGEAPFRRPGREGDMHDRQRGMAGFNRLRMAALAATLLGALVLSFAAGAEADAAKEKRGGDNVRRYEVPVDSPESVIYDRQTNAFYGGSSNPDGRVYKAKLDGERLDGRARVFMRPGEDGESNPRPHPDRRLQRR